MHICERLEQKLTREDNEDIKRCLFDYMLENNLTAADVTPDSELALLLVPYMAEINEEWAEIESLDIFKGTKIMEDYKCLLRNQFRNKGAPLNKKLKAEMQIRSEEARSKESLKRAVMVAKAEVKTKQLQLSPT